MLIEWQYKPAGNAALSGGGIREPAYDASLSGGDTRELADDSGLLCFDAALSNPDARECCNDARAPVNGSALLAYGIALLSYDSC